jgi:iron(III) transport system ATP-binding protein
VTSPDVVLLDEPLANLDRHLKQEMEETFREFHQRSGATMIYVTHDQSEAMALATDVAVMSEGRLLQVAPPAEIYARPEGRIVGGLIGRGAILTLPLMGRERHLEWDELQDALHAANSDDADVLVRPEDVVIGGEGAPATVESVLFEGERYAVKLTLGNSQTLRAFSRVAVVPGETVRVVIRAGWRL